MFKKLKAAWIKMKSRRHEPSIYDVVASKLEQNQATVLRFRLAQQELPKPKSMTFKQAKVGNVEARLQYIRYRWHTYNDKKFGSNLQEPRFSFNSRRYLGCWSESSPIHGARRLIPEIAVRQILFKGTKKFLDMVILHEMCHQAHSELLKCPMELTKEEKEKATNHEVYKYNNGHGLNWFAWMKFVGGEVDMEQ
jgi:hypothetical protein